MLELKNISYSVKNEENRTILKDINLKLLDNKIYAVTGPNGSGKSSLARIIMGIASPDEGSILLNGQEITQMDITARARMGIGYAFQQPPRFKGIKVKELLQLSSENNIKKGQTCDLLFNVGLCSQDYLNRDMDTSLSGGETKRIEIATILARDLKVAIFDEPEAGIDLWSFQKLAETFRVIHEKKNTSIVIISHQERILELADEIILLSEGTIQKNIPKQTILKKRFMEDLCSCRAACGKRGEENVECIG